MKLNKTLIIAVLTLFSSQLFSQEESMVIKKEAFTIGETITLHSKILNEDRAINIYLPNGYSPDSLHKYPVIYLLDGSVDEDFIHIAGLVQFGSFSWINMLPETIVVGVANVDRKRDFTFPTTIKKHKKEFPTTGGSAAFINFIEKELQPFINQNYKVSTTKTLMGQSLGGLLATEVLFKKPDLFTNYIIISPSLWWDKQSLLKSTPESYTSTKLIYVGVGKEGKVMEKDAKKLHKKLTKIGQSQTQLFFGFFEKQNHGDVLHVAAYDAFEKMFKTIEK